MADADRLQAIQDQYSRAVEARITDLMARVHAAREINRQIAEADEQIAIAEGDVGNLESELGEIDADSPDYEAGAEQVEALRGGIAQAEGYRSELVEALAKLTGEFGG